jgi:hypothetical protein
MLFSLHSDNRTWSVEYPRLNSDGISTLLKLSTESFCRIVPILPREESVFERKKILVQMIRDLIIREDIRDYTFSTSTCLSVPYLRNLTPEEIHYEPDLAEVAIHPELFLEMNEYAE